MRRFLPLVLFLCLPAVARISADVSAFSPAYQLVDKLESYHCAYTTFRSLGPQAFYAVRSAIDVGEGREGEVTEDGRPARCSIPNWMRKDRDLLMHGIPFTTTVTGLTVRNETQPLLGIDAILPTASFPLRGGRPTFDGANVYVELSAQGEGGGNDFGVAFGASPGLLAAFQNYANLDGRFYVYEAYVKVGYRWVELTAGKTAMRFGDALHGTLLLTDAQLPFTNLKLTVRPHRLGSPFSFLGPFTFETWVTDTTGATPISDSRYWALALGFRPLTWFEVAAMEIYQLGGTGIPSPSVGDLASMLVYLNNPTLAAERQRAFALNLNFWGPDHYFKLYVQTYFDKLSSPSYWFSDQLSPLVGLWFPRLGDFDVRLELVHTVPTAYESVLYPQGLTYAHTPVGSPLGPDADGVYFDFGIPPLGDWRPSLNFTYEARGKHPKPGNAIDQRLGGGLDLTKRWLRSQVSFMGRYFSVANHDYIPGNALQTVAGYLSYTYNFY